MIDTKVDLHIRNNTTGEVVSIPSHGVVFFDEESQDYDCGWYEHGNASCDCNRHEWSLEAKGIDGGEESECGDAVAYSVRLTLAGEPTIIYDEWNNLIPHWQGYVRLDDIKRLNEGAGNK